MKKIVLIIATLIVGAIVLVAIVKRDFISTFYSFYQLKPEKSFDESLVPPAPDYADNSWWAALPGQIDDADVTPEGVVDGQSGAEVDVFYIHPTTYWEVGNGWNQPLENEISNQRLNLGVLQGQTSVFNGCCKIYVPKYRQASLPSFFDTSDGPKAMALAYIDVKTAFEYFLANYNEGRPFILASHSQGSMHAVRLLEEYFTGTLLLDQLVAAYLVGGPMIEEHMAKTLDIPLCSTATMTGCQMSWNTVSDAAADFSEVQNYCVNPLNWTADGTPASHQDNMGGVRFLIDNDTPSIDHNVTGAVCVDGNLMISIPEGNYDEMVFGEGNYHIYDYALFYMNIRNNAIERAAAFVSEAG
ncbi:MAG: DUF3089 domain-containing protein [Pseudomonadales bacterium]|nr:DUF3089 domain-containing protein [Pseudomonadales bacterium]